MKRTAGWEGLQGADARDIAMKGEHEIDIYERSNLTKQQLLIWLGQKLAPEAPLYNVAETFTLSGRIDRAHFQNAFQTLVNSSDALRTVIEETDEVPQQKVLETFPYKIEYLDFSVSSEPQAAFENWLRTRWRVPFDLRERLFDSALAKIAEERFVWYLNVHHIITDGWSESLLFRYVSEFYERSLSGRLEEVVALPRFQDYVRYEREERASARHRQAEAYWERRLAEKAEALNIDGRAYLKRTAGVQKISCELGVERTRKLKALAARQKIAGATERASLFHLFAAALFTYLYRVSGNGRQSIGVPFHNREAKSFRETLGLFMTVLPLRITVERGDTFLSVIRKVRDEMAEIRPFRGVALANSHHHRLYDVVLNYYTMSYPKFHGMPTRVELVHTGPEEEALNLRVHDFDDAGSLALDFSFHRDVFKGEQAEQAMRHFLQILDALVDDPSGSLDAVSLLTREERHRILVEWNDTKRDYPKDKCIHQLFEEQVERTPDAVAVIFEDRQLTYRELNARANQLAHYLRKSGVEPETRVGIHIERSLEMTIAILGVLKAGGAYVPLDSAYPKERLAFMLAETQPVLLLTKRPLPDDFPEFHGQALCLDRDCGMVAGEKEQNLETTARPDNLAYIMYTSGSTGRPKGVLIRHSGVANYFFYLHETYNFSGADTVLQLAPLSFDASVRDLIAPLTSGARVVLVDEFDSKEPAALISAMTKHRVTCLPSMVPTMLNAVVDAASGRARLDSMRLILVSGEALSGSSCRRAQEVFGSRVSIVNQYGPTESTMTCSYHRVVEAEYNRGIVPLGKPIRNVRMHILDNDLQIVPVGIPGELHIGGAGLARGYLNSPDFTAEKFIPSPFSDEPGARLYKTGDLARYLPDGNIEFLGRIDDQVKIRGFRIEPGEIEAALRQHAGVRECVVMAREEVENPKSEIRNPKFGVKRLIAYVVAQPASVPSARELRSLLKSRLPDYMIPSSFVFLAALPLTPNGKVDRLALPAPDRTKPELESPYVTPRTETENLVAAIWAEVLKLDQVGGHDNFFDLGGQSLSAAQVISRVRETFQIELPLRRIFETPTVAGLADAVQQARDNVAERPAPKISPVPRPPRRMKSSL